MKIYIFTFFFLCAANAYLFAQDVKPTSYKNCPDSNHPHMIDLGLPSGTKWACCNVDAKKPEDSGGFYAWGETTMKSDEYSWKTYRHCNGTQESCFNLGSSICGTKYDVAYVKWGKQWQLPTYDQIFELKAKCKNEWMTKNGVKGRRFIGPNGASIFLPEGGCIQDTSFYAGGYGDYWSGTQITSISNTAYFLYIGADYAQCYGGFRCYGRSVRPVAR